MKSFSRLVINAGFGRAGRAPVRTRATAHCIIPRASVVPVTRSRILSPPTMLRPFHSSISFRGMLPDDSGPPPKPSPDQPTVPTDIPTSEFHERADRYLDDLVNRLEELQEKNPDIEVEYSAGVLEAKIASKGQTYVLNKQPPNKQIWLSSPISGPKRFDWVVQGESMNHKEGGGVGDWIYLRDGTSLTELIRKELGVDVSVDDDAPS